MCFHYRDQDGKVGIGGIVGIRSLVGVTVLVLVAVLVLVGIFVLVGVFVGSFVGVFDKTLVGVAVTTGVLVLVGATAVFAGQPPMVKLKEGLGSVTLWEVSLPLTLQVKFPQPTSWKSLQPISF